MGFTADYAKKGGCTKNSTGNFTNIPVNYEFLK